MGNVGNKGPRNAAGHKRTKVFRINLAEEEYLFIRKKAAEAGLFPSVYARQVCFEGHVNARLSDEDRQLFMELVRMSNDLHQLCRIAEDQGVAHALSSFETGRNAIDLIIKKLKI